MHHIIGYGGTCSSKALLNGSHGKCFSYFFAGILF
uniref:Uncharacterized protein n=1 Tax=Anguilla anguilla TaxID=7936 RepID=A0A0E9QLV9_ANGAN